VSSLLTRLVQHYRGFSHQQTLARLKSLGFVPSVVYDIGAHKGKWTGMARGIYPEAQYLLFEANSDNERALQDTGERYCIAALAAEDAVQREFYLPRYAVSTGASFYKERTVHYTDDKLRIERLQTQRLDSLCARQGLAAPDLLKLDVQGAELDVLTGAGDLLANCGAIIAELSFLAGNEGAPLAPSVMVGIERLGFKCVDICKVRRTKIGAVGQIDVLFANAALYEAFRAPAGLL